MKLIFGIIMAGFSLVLGACASTSLQANNTSSVVDDYYAAEKAYKSGAYQKAEQLYGNLEKLQPNNINVLLRLGNLHVRKKRYDQAKAYYSRVLKLAPNSQKAHYNLAALYLEMSEKHFQYYAANNHDKNTDPELLKLLVAIQKFSSVKSKSNNPLDALADLIVQGKSGSRGN